MGRSRRQHWKTALLAAGACGWLLVGCHRPKPAPNPHPKSPNPPNVEGLRAALERSAAAALPAPSLVNQRLLIAAKLGEVDAKAKEVLRIGTDSGATLLPGASHNPARSGTTLLFRLPEERVGEFARRVQSSSEAATVKSRGEGPQFNTHLDNPVESALVEVAIEADGPVSASGGVPASGAVSENRGDPGPENVPKSDGASLPPSGAAPESTP